jgi:hypothetical protein
MFRQKALNGLNVLLEAQPFTLVLLMDAGAELRLRTVFVAGSCLCMGSA